MIRVIDILGTIFVLVDVTNNQIYEIKSRTPVIKRIVNIDHKYIYFLQTVRVNIHKSTGKNE